MKQPRSALFYRTRGTSTGRPCLEDLNANGAIDVGDVLLVLPNLVPIHRTADVTGVVWWSWTTSWSPAVLVVCQQASPRPASTPAVSGPDFGHADECCWHGSLLGLAYAFSRKAPLLGAPRGRLPCNLALGPLSCACHGTELVVSLTEGVNGF